MPLDLSADLAAALPVALRTPEGRAAFDEVLGPIVEARLQAALTRHYTDQRVDITGAAKHVGMSRPAFNVRMGADAELQRLRLGTGRLTRFRVSDLDNWLANRQSQKGRRRRAG